MTGWLLAVLVLVLAAPVAAQEPPPPSSRLVRLGQVAILSGATADVLSTLDNNAWRNIYEANPIIAKADGSASVPRLLIVKGVWAAFGIYLTEQWRKAGHPKLGAVVGFVIGGVDWSVAWHNSRLPERVRR